MIRYDFDYADVVSKIDSIDKHWHDKASGRTEDFIKLGSYEEKSSIWSDVKPVFMDLQSQKCVYCERQFESAQYGNIEFDLEHFRPKSAVKAWLPSEADSDLAKLVALGNPSANGYYWLAYELRNYAVSCKVCNSPLKNAYFPVAGSRAAKPCGYKNLKKERPLLCYPLGDVDDDPEDLITFVGTTAKPRHASGMKNIRARTIIDFFALNGREHLHKQRALMIALMGSFLKDLDDPVGRDELLEAIDRMLLPAVPHASCVRAFKRCWDENREVGEAIYRRCRLAAAG